MHRCPVCGANCKCNQDVYHHNFGIDPRCSHCDESLNELERDELEDEFDEFTDDDLLDDDWLNYYSNE